MRQFAAPMIVMLLALGGSPVSAKEPPPPETTPVVGTFDANPREVSSTGRISFASVTPCPPTQGPAPRIFIQLFMKGDVAARYGRAASVPVDSLGRWGGEIAFEGLPIGRWGIGARCQTGDGVIVEHQIYPPLDITIVPGRPTTPTFTATPTLIAPNGRVGFASATPCPPADEGLNLQASVVLHAGTSHGAATDVAVDSAGRWSGNFTFEGAPLPVGRAQLSAECETLDGSTQTYVPVEITVAPASAVEARPRLTG